jgi:uncharacterized membrane protein
MDGYDWMRVIHLLAMAFFVGGQLLLVATIVPVLRGHAQMKLVARRYGWGSLIAIFISLVTGMVMGLEYDSFDEPAMSAKMGVLIVVSGLIVLHMRRPEAHWVQGLVFVGSLALVVLGVTLSH